MTPHILLINPNSSLATSDMMQAIALKAAGGRLDVRAVTADRSPSMITTPEQLVASAAQVVELGTAHDRDCVGIIVSAFGDPGLAELRRKVNVPVVGICEASMIEASQGGRRFAVATSTPDLVDAIDQRARDLGLDHLYTGVRCTAGDPLALAAEAGLLAEALAGAVRECIERDGAEAVIIGGGPLGQAAEQLRTRFGRPVLGPIPCAVDRVFSLIDRDGVMPQAI
ncbi:aspartate/glutamate racemase family protein [Shinella curvata]|uniref:Aspartate/glutamate racemase family protein n=1 Tax=Shinella curvata TaxID=1817964 RepID=A0ABT8XAS3_9HYPH|nr:aspartate/glutamate racemase family protein [Shinella curvata]MCJ8054768.1 aspartate/glutamate racemase family protein [Shinella curvata]MDO6120837.1 aspartate/glutamate racemase family protein [Shinella curvata]